MNTSDSDIFKVSENRDIKHETHLICFDVFRLTDRSSDAREKKTPFSSRISRMKQSMPRDRLARTTGLLRSWQRYADPAAQFATKRKERCIHVSRLSLDALQQPRSGEWGRRGGRRGGTRKSPHGFRVPELRIVPLSTLDHALDQSITRAVCVWIRGRCSQESCARSTSSGSSSYR